MKVSLIVDRPFQANRIFDFSAKNPINRDEGVYPFYLLKEKLKTHGIDISTSDINQPEQADLVIAFDMPRNLDSFIDLKNKKFLVLFESELISPSNWNTELHSHFSKIFTWNSKIVDGKKYIKCNFPNKLKLTKPGLEGRDKFACLIAGNKTNKDPRELYSRRIETIRWFETHQPGQFDLYGVGWDEFTFTGPKLVRVLNRFKFLRKYLADKYPSFRGRVSSKLETLRKYRFSICYENAQQIPGYITEKVFDSFFAGCIPVYWGPPDVDDLIPKDCYIDRQRFSNHEELYKFMKSLSDDQILEYQMNIERFLGSEQVIPFSAEYFAETLVGEILKDLE